MRDDKEIKADVESEMRWSRQVDAARIVVNVSDGLVTLSGFAPKPADKLNAEIAAQRVHGVAAVANDIEVALRAADRQSDPEIAREALAILRTELPSAAQDVQVIVRGGHVTLEGAVQWHWQRQRIESAVREVKGVTAVANQLGIRPVVTPTDIKQRIERAFLDCAALDGKGLVVETRDSAVTLRGQVHSEYERDEAQRTAWSTPGVTEVVNQIEVGKR